MLALTLLMSSLPLGFDAIFSHLPLPPAIARLLVPSLLLRNVMRQPLTH
jgi:hypothetical protein